jgi:ornithine carbamoyltransferase
MDACIDADIIVTDVWTSMGQESEQKERELAFKGFRVDKEMMSKAKNDVIFMHCLPAYRGKEVSADVIDGKQSVIWDEAENRLHVQKALLLYLIEN